jgi:hypothetical protein
MSEPYRRYSFPPERALSIWGCAGAMLSSLHSLEQHEVAADRWLTDFKAQLGNMESDVPPEPPDDSQAIRTALLDQLGALRRDLADLTADADSYLPEVPAGGSRDIVIDRTVSPPDARGLPPPLALMQFQRWYAQGTASHFRTASENARHLLRHLGHSSDSETVALCDALREFIRGVHGSESP